GADVRQVRLGPARVDDDVPGEVVGLRPLPGVHDLPFGQVNLVQPRGVKLGDVDAPLVRRQRDAAHHVAGLDLADHLARLEVDLADGAGVLVGDEGAAAVLGDDD